MKGPPVQIEMFPTAVHLTRIDPEQNAQRYYYMQVVGDLFGGAALERQWGRIGRTCRYRLDLFEDHASAVDALAELARKKVGRGYVRTR